MCFVGHSVTPGEAEISLITFESVQALAPGPVNVLCLASKIAGARRAVDLATILRFSWLTRIRIRYKTT